MLKGMIFDLDGTLINSLHLTFDAFNYALNAVDERSLPPQELMKHFGGGEDKIFAKLLTPEKATSAYLAYSSYIEKHLDQIPLHQGIKETLERILYWKLPVSIVTGRSWKCTKTILEHHRLVDSFTCIIADDHVDHPKPSPLGIHKALSLMNLTPRDIYYVGDSAIDIQAAHSAGARSIAALWDLFVKRELLEQSRPHFWAHHPQDILRIKEQE